MSDKKNILVVNDEQAVRQILGNMLKDRGYNVFMAEDGYKAIEKVKEISFAIIFLDMMMPGIAGRLKHVPLKTLDLLMRYNWPGNARELEKETHWVQTKAAKLLGISRRIIKYKMEKYGIEKG